MIIHFLSYLLFFLLTFQINGMEEVESLLGGDNEPFVQHQVNQTLVEIDASTTPNHNPTASDLDINPSDELRRGTHGESLEELREDDDSRRLLILNEEDTYAPLNDSETTLFKYMDEATFDTEDSYLASSFRWTGRLIGLMGENAVVPMILYVLLNLFDISVNHHPYSMGIIDATIVGVMLAYFFLPATGNMAQAGQEFYEFCGPHPLVPKPYRAFNPCSPLPLSLNIGSKFHAASMAIMLTTVFHHIENSNVASYNWYFLTFFAPYGIAIFNKNKSYFEHGRRMQKIYQRSESKPERKTRKILEASYKKCEETLQSLDDGKLKELYDYLKDPRNLAAAKSRKLHQIANPDSALLLLGDGQREEDELSRRARMRHSSSWSWKDELSQQVSNLAFYGSTISEYYFYQFGVSLLSIRLGASSPLATNLGYGGAAILSILSYIFEDTSVREYYEAVIQRSFGSPHSASNPILRRGIGVKSFMMGALLALSECYPAWKATLSSGSASWPLLAFMVARRHAPNALWLEQGYDRSLSDWHSRDCKRDSCKGCKRGEGEQEMINYISRAIHKRINLRKVGQCASTGQPYGNE